MIAVNEDGKLTMVTLVTLLFFLLLIGFVCNVGVAVKRKMDLQNAADAAAYSTSLWRARGMNAVTASNHLLGEATALITIIDSFGGRQLASGDETSVIPESAQMCRTLRLLLDAPPFPPWAGGQNFSQALEQPDKKLVELVMDELLPQDEAKDGVHQSGAMLYDAKLTLRNAAITCLAAKKIARTVSELCHNIPFGIGPAIEAVCLGIHVHVSLTVLTRVLLEAKSLNAAEDVMVLLVPARNGIRNALIPALSFYGDAAAGRLPGGGPPGSAGGNTLLSQGASRSLQELQEFYGGQGIELRVFPSVKKLTLPVEPESSLPSGSRREVPPSEWSESFEQDPRLKEVRILLNPLGDRLTNSVEKINQVLGFAVEILEKLNVPVDALKQGLANLTNATGKFREWMELLKSPQYPRDYASNPCRDLSSDHPMPQVDVEQERISQLARAGYPYVDSFRGPLYRLLHEYGKLSAAGHLYVHYTNRYLLANSFDIRTGNDGAPAAHAYVMQNSPAARRGYESWTSADAEAEQMFSLAAVAWSNRMPPMLLRKIFTNPHRQGHVALAGSMIYNANGREVPPGGPQRRAVQVNSGWNTLNWTPPVAAPEWGDHRPDQRGASITGLFTGSQSSAPSAQVQIDWQAKLIPLAPSGSILQPLVQGVDNASSDLPGESREILKKTFEHPELLGH
ncbi:pilus assembly protein TadG-related protein [Lignipirellula cremea]|uniref:pilus assembly protein TadG-related protein n=1 Tax=Lignipirellula cremea TaxID=2528010 RepID=UPI0018D23773|nr:pilus assembly protein TadG-related protein [Lignipirellula cremea]